jgi:hypothetical protein
MPGDRGQLKSMWLLPFAAAVEDPPLVRILPRGSIQGLGRPMVPTPPRSPTAFGDHTQAMPRPVAKIVRACAFKGIADVPCLPRR